MHTKKITKASKRRLLVFGTLASFLIIYSFITFTTYILDIENLKNEERHLSEKLDKLKEDEEAYKTEIEKLKDDDYLARYAREKYLYSKNGEYILKLEDKNTEVVEEKKIVLEKKYVILFSCVTLFIVGFIINRSKNSR